MPWFENPLLVKEYTSIKDNLFRSAGYSANIEDMQKKTKAKLTRMTVERDALKKVIDDTNTNIQEMQEEQDFMKKTSMVLAEASKVARTKAKNHFEKIITEALRYVTQSDDYEFVIQEKEERSKTSYEFYIKTIINGEESLQNPKDANGGGFVDIISVAMKYAYLELFNDPAIMNSSVILDEPGKMIDEQRSIKFAEYVKELGSIYDRQTIMITHNNNLSDTADRTYYVSQGDDMISQVSKFEDVVLDTIQLEVEESLNEN